ncbi:hypothetical protein GWK47_009269 [Chionoecetes opilio]|uniref:Neurotransmitter-gated ion-channel transmembrane domain-containing protein n=1 Tax=Chionoecetes opilio TaxID=41210 RepID=A0A8J4Y4I3_CHIOP|nr:hypothetical protein GWK47_009269 [Chionoecetes opilio]
MIVLTVFLPTAMLQLVGYTTLFVNVALMDVRMAVSLTTLLVLYTLFSNTSDALPITAYVKLIDVWFFFCIFLLFFIIVIHTVVEHLVNLSENKSFTQSSSIFTGVSPVSPRLQVGRGYIVVHNKLLSGTRDSNLDQLIDIDPGPRDAPLPLVRMEAGVQGQSHLLLSSPHRHPSLAGPQRHPLAAPTSATQHSLSLDSSVFGLVVDACTDFKTSGGITGDKTQDTSPQQSYRLTPTPPETPEDINPTPTSTPTPNTNPGSLPPSPSLTRKFLYGLLVQCYKPQNMTKERRSIITKEGDAGPSSVAGRSDALKTLTETSTALALTETLIGPLRLPPIPPGVLHEVLSGMERRASPPPGTHRAGWGSRGSAVERDKVLLHTQEPGHRGLTNGAAAAAAAAAGGGGGGEE